MGVVQIGIESDATSNVVTRTNSKGKNTQLDLSEVPGGFCWEQHALSTLSDVAVSVVDDTVESARVRPGSHAAGPHPGQ